MPIRAIFTAPPVLMRTPCRTRRSLNRMVRTNSKGSISCARFAASILVCPVACTCIWATERCWRPYTRRCSEIKGLEMPDNREFQEQVGRIEGLVHEIESIADPALRATAKELVRSLMDLHRAGLE